MRRRSDDASPREQHNRGERRRIWRDPGLDGGERCLGKFSDDSCTTDPRGLAVNPSAAVTIRGQDPHVDHSGHAGHGHSHMVADLRKRFWISVLLTLPVLALSPAIQHALGVGETWRFAGGAYILVALSSVIYFYGGWPFLDGLRQEVSTRNLGMMTLIGVAITAAYIYSVATVIGLAGSDFFWELVTLIDVMLLGHWIEMKSVIGAGAALETLAALIPDTAHLLSSDGSTQDIAVATLKGGEHLLVKPGERVPADAIIVEGQTSANESMLTGESKPVAKKEGDTVIGGAINGEGAIVIEVRHTGADSFLSGVIKLVQEAQASKSHTQDIANRAAFWLTVIALSAGTLTLMSWAFFSPQGLAFSIERAVTVLVTSCPHALGLAVPLVVAVSTSIAAANGLLIRDRTAFEGARRTQAVVFDKTGTLTKGEFGITDVLMFDNAMKEDELVAYAASIEQHSEHPIAEGIVKSAKDKWPVESFQAIPGKGAQGTVKGKNVKAVSPGYLREKNISAADPRIAAFGQQGKTVIFVLIGDELKGAIALADIIRPESKEAIARLKAMSIRCIMLTGDKKEVADWVAKEIGLDEVIAEVLPDQKVAKIREVQSRGLITAMTGDGVNDAPALAQADVGIAIGAGTDVALEAADIILVKSNPHDVAALIGLARATYSKMIQNLVWATGYNVIAIPAAAGVLAHWGLILGPAVGAALMSASTVICAVNARMLRLT
jgi:Cu2+-exporting ATPase